MDAPTAARFIPAHAGTTTARRCQALGASVHPRACGDHQPDAVPRPRGFRFIPAHAGTTGGCTRTIILTPVHPRACGDHTFQQWVGALELRFIPAHAGTTRAPGRIGHADAVHPRACGDHGGHAAPPAAPSGSSPRMRGPPALDAAHADVLRFIPAHAGTTSERTSRRLPDAVHPRACGDHSGNGVPSVAAAGSSPRMRGPLAQHHQLRPVHRFIPAHAGTTMTCHSNSAKPCGSSPRMRGPRDAHVHRARARRFIPAHAGTTPRTPRSRWWRPVHPRACGDHERPEDAGPPRGGSSPRMRGPLPKRKPREDVRRFIPAHAGTTWDSATSRSRATVHPRACGDHPVRIPPGTRSVRFIPAHAGTTRTPRAPGRARPVHPRACGDHSGACRSGRRRVRFIPAHAGTTTAAPRGGESSPVHPRACGDHSSLRRNVSSSGGSSPRMRGPRLRPQGTSRLRRFIPAHAGTTTIQLPVYVLDSRFIPAHAGTTKAADKGILLARGSSPRMRGPRHGPAPSRWCRRFIPAHAGTTSCRTRRRTHVAVHPRACGDHGNTEEANIEVRGSSPRMRGPRDHLRAQAREVRFIPAHAGTTSSPLRTTAVTAGSSPRMRGPPRAREHQFARGRFIPAHAGTTASSARPPTTGPVHPRACGDHGLDRTGLLFRHGSSPRMRGPRRRDHLGGERLRFIPAHAGTTRRCWAPGRTASVHPRACGDHCRGADGGWRANGSSPRMRGPPTRESPERPHLRFIPAHAGTTPPVPPGRAPPAVHPRACGDHGRRRRARTPRARFIPAHAGTTIAERLGLSASTVHPRACGDHRPPARRTLEPHGSSPRMRGPQ